MNKICIHHRTVIHANFFQKIQIVCQFSLLASAQEIFHLTDENGILDPLTSMSMILTNGSGKLTLITGKIRKKTARKKISRKILRFPIQRDYIRQNWAGNHHVPQGIAIQQVIDLA